MLMPRDEFPHSVDDARENLKRAASKEYEAFSEAESKVHRERTELRRVAKDQFNAWRILRSAMATENRVDFEDLAETFKSALKEVEAALQKAAPGEWLEYVQSRKEMNEAEAELAKAAPVKWAWWRFMKARQRR